MGIYDVTLSMPNLCTSQHRDAPLTYRSTDSTQYVLDIGGSLIEFPHSKNLTKNLPV